MHNNKKKKDNPLLQKRKNTGGERVGFPRNPTLLSNFLLFVADYMCKNMIFNHERENFQPSEKSVLGSCVALWYSRVGDSFSLS